MLIGHDRVIAYLDSVFTRGVAAHAYLFTGPESIGKRTIALCVAQSFFCARAGRQPSRACQQCDQCLAIATNRHPGVAILGWTHENADEKSSPKTKQSTDTSADRTPPIAIGDIRAIQRRLILKAPAWEWRVFILAGAHRMTREAAGALLKTLEEPHPQTLFLLTTNQPDLIPETIVSRSVILRLSSVSASLLADTAKKYATDVKTADEAVRFAAGRPGLLITFLTDPRERMRAATRAGRISEIFNGTTLDALRIAALVWQDAAESRRLIEDAIRGLRADLLQNYTSRGKIFSIISAARRIENIRHITETSAVNRRLALEAVLMQAQKIKGEKGETRIEK